MHHITSTELSHWVTLSQTPDVGSAFIKKLLKQFHSIEKILNASSTQLKQCKLNNAQIDCIQHPNYREIELVQKWLEENNQNHFISFLDERYPALLKEISSAPAVLYVQGDITALHDPQIAMVGSRNPSHTGLELANEFAFILAQAGLHITSGLALGIDTASHEGAMLAHGKTIAVLGNGLLHRYPKRNHALAEKIIQHGCLVSEFPLNATPLRENFPRRNRIISGLSLGTLVVEAALKSGSLITAKFALEQNRDVFAIPGSLRNPASTGCLTLIQDGAKCVIKPSDILTELNYDSRHSISDSIIPTKQNTQFVHLSSLDCNEQLVLACIGSESTSVDQICTHSKLSAQIVTSALLELEMIGVIKVQNGGYTKI